MLRGMKQTIKQINRDKYCRLWFHPGRSVGSVCLEGTGVMVIFVAGRFFGGDTIAQLARDYGVSPVLIQQAIRLVGNSQRQHRSPEMVFKTWERTR